MLQNLQITKLQVSVYYFITTTWSIILQRCAVKSVKNKIINKLFKIYQLKYALWKDTIVNTNSVYIFTL